MFWTGIAIGGLIGTIIGAGMMICAIVVWAGVYRAAQIERDELTQLDFDGLVDEIRQEAGNNDRDFD